MNQQQFDQTAYLRRIKYVGETEPTVDTLKALHHAQLYTIPFENFDIQLGREINLNTETIFEKLVHKGRGGYCFELNGLTFAVSIWAMYVPQTSIMEITLPLLIPGLSSPMPVFRQYRLRMVPFTI